MRLHRAHSRLSVFGCWEMYKFLTRITMTHGRFLIRVESFCIRNIIIVMKRIFFVEWFKISFEAGLYFHQSCSLVTVIHSVIYLGKLGGNSATNDDTTTSGEQQDPTHTSFDSEEMFKGRQKIPDKKQVYLT